MNSDGSDIYIYPRVLDLGLDAEVSFLPLKNTITISNQPKNVKGNHTGMNIWHVQVPGTYSVYMTCVHGQVQINVTHTVYNVQPQIYKN